MSFVCLLLGTFKISFLEVIKAIFNQSNDINNRVILNIRIPRVLASIICGAGLSVAGLIMQTTLSNEMATPSTLGVSSSCVLGANVSIIIFAGGFLSTGNYINNYINSINPFSTSLMAFIFAIISILLILGLCKIKSFSPTTVVLSGLALSSVWSSLTTLLQYFATDSIFCNRCRFI
ncbi:iron compound ABC transporter permease protein [Firmicutes bacterium CAG:449]|nr:iron compound ABC transporter permease protein [Firmicutes bacterium CAG:449]